MGGWGGWEEKNGKRACNHLPSIWISASKFSMQNADWSIFKLMLTSSVSCVDLLWCSRENKHDRKTRHFVKLAKIPRNIWTFRWIWNQNSVRQPITTLAWPQHDTFTSCSREITSLIFKIASSSLFTRQLDCFPKGFLAPLLCFWLSLDLVIFLWPERLSGIVTEVGKVRFILGAITDYSISLSCINFGFTTFSVAAIKQKPSLVLFS